MIKLTISVKEASEISGLSTSFIRKQVENRSIPSSYSIQHSKRKEYVIFRNAFIKWLDDIKGVPYG